MIRKLIRVTCEGATLIKPEELNDEFQGTFKSLEKTEFEKLRGALIKYGFSFPCDIWKAPDGQLQVVDATQRLRVLRTMLKDGYKLEGDKVPVVWIQAKDEREAFAKVLLRSSNFGKYNDESFYEFLHASGLVWEDIKLEVDLPQLDFARFEAGYIEDLPDDETEDDEEPNTLPAKCPHCAARLRCRDCGKRVGRGRS